ncbi:MAG: glutamyl-tRNA reductase [Chloroflexi bacterium]|nr:glutamyl-tRNA reductase [Chloroflexota bacterium]
MFFCRSVSHHRTPLAIREQLSLTSGQQADWLAQHNGIEAAIVSTCNRLELYAHIPTSEQMDELWTDLLRQRHIVPGEIAAYTAALAGFDAVEHLFRVSCGLESMALGEPQIVGQVASAHELAHDNHTMGTALSLLFRSAIHAAKRARTETAIGSGSASVSSLGITRAEAAHGSLTEANVLVLGAGEMGETIVKALDQRGIRKVTVLSRTYDRARRLATTYQANARPITELKDALTEADVLFTTSSAPFTILTCDDVTPIMLARPDRSLCMIDIAVPRDVDPVVGDIPGVYLYDLDDLQLVIEDNLAERRANIPAVERIIEDELACFWTDYQSRSVVPTIRLLREHAEQLRQTELTWAYNRLSPDSEHERLLFEQFSHRFMNKILHHLTRNLKEKAGQADGDMVVAVAKDLFGLEDNYPQAAK